MDFNNRNNQKKHYSHFDSDSDSFNNKKGEDNIIPEVLYDNYDDNQGNGHINHNSNHNFDHPKNSPNDPNYNSKIDSKYDSNLDSKILSKINEGEDINIADTLNIRDGDSYNQNNESISPKPVDVRIICSSHEDSEFLSKAIKNVKLLKDFNIIISSIITTTNVEIAKNAVIGSDVILIATNSDEDGKRLFSKFFNALKTDLNYLEFLNFPKLRDIEITDIKNVEAEIKNSIIRAGLRSIFDIANINQVKSEIVKINHRLKNSEANNEKLTLENDMLIEEAKELRNKNDELKEEIADLQKEIDQVKIDFTDYKSRYSNIHSRNLLEVFSIKDLWFEVFDEGLNDDDIDKVLIATNKFRPENVLLGQGYIGAISKNDAIDWIKIVKTALIFVESSNDELQDQLIDYYKKKHQAESYHYDNLKKESNSISNSFHDNQDNSYNNPDNVDSQDSLNSRDSHNKDYDKDYDGYIDNNKDYKDYNRDKSRNRQVDEEENDYDYDMLNQFQNFWD